MNTSAKAIKIQFITYRVRYLNFCSSLDINIKALASNAQALENLRNAPTTQTCGHVPPLVPRGPSPRKTSDV